MKAFRSIHDIGVIHGDVRRENILVREDDSVVIVDFESGEFENIPEEALRMEEEAVVKLMRELEKGNYVSEEKKVAGEDSGFFEF